jgi:hypothetical protein
MPASKDSIWQFTRSFKDAQAPMHLIGDGLQFVSSCGRTGQLGHGQSLERGMGIDIYECRGSGLIYVRLRVFHSPLWLFSFHQSRRTSPFPSWPETFETWQGEEVPNLSLEQCLRRTFNTRSCLSRRDTPMRSASPRSRICSLRSRSRRLDTMTQGSQPPAEFF